MGKLGSRLVDWFVVVGNKLFAHDSGHYVLFQPILYAAMFAASVNKAISNNPPIPFGNAVGPYAPELWIALSIWCPIMAAMSWWLIRRCAWNRAALAGLWLRLGSDFGQFVALLVFYAVNLNFADNDESHLYSHYVVGAVLVYVLHLIMRDVWSIVATERLADRLQIVE